MLKHALKKGAFHVLGPTNIARLRILKDLKYGEPELALLRRLSNPVRSFLDVGANLGIYALYGTRYFNHVYAIEPHPALGSNLKTILGRSGTVMAVAASDRSGTSEFSIPTRNGRDVHARSSLEADANPGYGSRTVTVAVDTIDSLGFSNLGMVKIDVEGHELNVLNGARETLARQRPAVIVETEERHHAGAVERVRQFFGELDYEGFFIHRSVIRPMDDYDVGRFQSPQHVKSDDGKRSPDYINNLIFIPGEDEEMKRRLGPKAPPDR